jgi:hypothetical protein
MRICYPLGLALLVGAGCASGPGTEAQNPFNYCAAQGFERASQEFAACVDDYIVQACAAAGHAPGSDGYGECARDLQQSAFVRQQLEQRGY